MSLYGDRAGLGMAAGIRFLVNMILDGRKPVQLFVPVGDKNIKQWTNGQIMAVLPIAAGYGISNIISYFTGVSSKHIEPFAVGGGLWGYGYSEIY